MGTLSKQQLRTTETRARILDAAEEVFARDGYENAQLDEIGARAGRSKGAVYTHFKNKEDLFLALYENRNRAYHDRLVSAIKKCTSQKQSLWAFRDFWVGIAHDRTWPILTLEFKLFAFRHPEAITRFRKVLDTSKSQTDDAAYKQLFGHLKRSQKRENDLSLLALGPINSGLILEGQIEPDVLTEKALRRILGRIFDALIMPLP